MSAARFAGSHVAIVTPFLASGEVDWKAWSALVDFHLQQGSDGLVIGGTTGESVSLTDEELCELVRRAAEQGRGRLRIIAGAGSSSTADTVRRVRMLSPLPVDGLLIVTPAYNKPMQEGLYRHFEAAAAASTVPVVLYNVPSRTAVDMLPETVARLARVPNIAAIKEAVPSMPRIRELVQVCPAGFEILSGDDATARDAVANGACGVITVTGNVAPALTAGMIRAARAGDAAQAAGIDAQLAPLHEALFVETSPAPIKFAMSLIGKCEETVRLPLAPVGEQTRERVKNAMRGVGLIN